MASIAKELIGERFGRLTVLLRGANDAKSRRRYLCRCECGNHALTVATNLQNRNTKSCGCLRHTNAIHGMWESPIYKIWTQMIQRCHNPNNVKFYNYGGRGISVCDRWITSFSDFFADVGERPSKHHSLERFDNDKGYFPGNVAWALRHDQDRNKRNNHWIEIDGVRMVLSDWARLKDINGTTILNRILRGMTERDAVMTPARMIGRRVWRANH
jgi:hypothetical protein